MAGKVDHAAHSEAIAKVIAFAPYAVELRGHLAEILQSPIFKASPRSQHLLQYVVERALDGEFDVLKERLIGTELFERPPGYDTGQDAIVRVAASDVRKRLLQFYGSGEGHGRLRIDLPSGSYIPAFCLVAGGAHEVEKAPPALQFPITVEQPAQVRTSSRLRLAVSLPAALLLIIVATVLVVRGIGTAARPDWLPWSALFSKTSGQTNIVLSDTNLSALQFLLDFRLPLSDYANRHYLPNLDHPLSPDMEKVVKGLTGIDYTAPAAAADSVMVLRAAQIAGPYSTHIRVRPARSLQLRDFETDDNFILLGSPSSNPWDALFADQLDFAFDYDPSLGGEFVRNNHPHEGELPRYIPTALGGGTGRTFGIIAFTRNRDRTGSVLLVAGTTAEATEAGVDLLTNRAALTGLLQQQRIVNSDPPLRFEILLRVAEMAGTPAQLQVIAVHRLGARSPAR